jgi:hypothetical protein
MNSQNCSQFSISSTFDVFRKISNSDTTSKIQKYTTDKNKQTMAQVLVASFVVPPRGLGPLRRPHYFMNTIFDFMIRVHYFVGIYGYRGVQLEDIFKVGYVVYTEVSQEYHFYSTFVLWMK